VKGVANTAGERAGFEVFTDADLPTLLPQTDVLVMVLPSADDTRQALSAERIALLPDHAWVVNVGRGVTIDQDALVAALTRASWAARPSTSPIPSPTRPTDPCGTARTWCCSRTWRAASPTVRTPCSTTTSPGCGPGRPLRNVVAR
jgi:hypothetical protein